MKKNKKLSSFWLTFILLVVLTISLFCFGFFKYEIIHNLSSDKEMNLLYSYISITVIPLLSLLGSMLIYLTITDQRKASEIQQFENHFFKLIDFHKEFQKKINDGKVEFSYMKYSFMESYLYFYESLMDSNLSKEKQFFLIKSAFLIKYDGHTEQKFIKETYNTLFNKPLKSDSTEINPSTLKHYLESYFSNISFLINFINTNKFINKKPYFDLLVSQMSIEEQYILLFYLFNLGDNKLITYIFKNNILSGISAEDKKNFGIL